MWGVSKKYNKTRRKRNSQDRGEEERGREDYFHLHQLSTLLLPLPPSLPPSSGGYWNHQISLAREISQENFRLPTFLYKNICISLLSLANFPLRPPSIQSPLFPFFPVGRRKRKKVEKTKTFCLLSLLFFSVGGKKGFSSSSSPIQSKFFNRRRFPPPPSSFFGID